MHLLEHAVCVRVTGDSRLLLGVYMDDLIVTGGEAQAISTLKIERMSTFKMNDPSH